jgi:RND family efflux transporter MFP subunit
MNTTAIDFPVPKPAPQPSPSPLPAPTIKKRPRKLRRLGIALAILLLVGAAAGFYPRWRQRTAAAADTRQLAVPSVTLVAPAPGAATEGGLLPAEIKPSVEASIFARTNGYLKRRLVEIGAHVKAGQLLAEIDAPEVDRELEQARAQLVLAEASAALAKRTDARWQQMLKTGAVSKLDADDKQAADATAAANAEAARANVHRLEEMQGFEKVVAPFAGTITLRNVETGDLIVASSGKELFHLAKTEKLDIYVRVPQTQAADIRPGLLADVTIPEKPGQVFQAKVVTSSEAMSSTSRTLLTKLELDNSKHRIVTGSYAQVRFTGGQTDPALTLPSSAVMFRAAGLEVGVVGTNGTIELRKVQVGRDFGRTVEILAGLTSNDHVIANPPDSLVSGGEVQIANASEFQPPPNDTTKPNGDKYAQANIETTR